MTSSIHSTRLSRWIVCAVLISYIIVSCSAGYVRKHDEQSTIIASGSSHSGFHEPGSAEFNKAIAIALFLVCMAGVCSGLNVGLLSIDQVALKIKLKSGTPSEKVSAGKILALLENHHLLLSTLLVANALAMEALPIYLHEIVPAAMAVLISIIIVVIFGEILPQAICTGPKQFQIASMSIPIIKLLQLVFLPVCYPIAKVLDCLLGKHDSTRFQKNKKDLKAFIEQHSDRPANNNNHLQQFGFNAQEILMIGSTMDLRDQKVLSKMIKLDDIFMLCTQDVFSKELIKRIKDSGYSTVPVYNKERQKIVGCLRTKIILKCENKHLNKVKWKINVSSC